MKKLFFIFFAVLIVGSAVSCSAPASEPAAAESAETEMTEGYLFPDRDFASDNYLEMEESDAVALRDILLLADWTESDMTSYTGPGIMIVQYKGKDGSDVICMYKTVFDTETGTFYDTEYDKEYTCSEVELDIVNGVLEGYIN